MSSIALIPEAPVIPAPVPIPAYPQFFNTDVPANSGAVSAFQGFIRPFSEDEGARSVLRALEANQPLAVCAGRLHYSGSALPRHACEGYLTNMAEPFSVLMLEYAGTEHRRAFLLESKLAPRITLNPHVRMDKGIVIGDEFYPALCVYSGNLFRYAEQRDQAAQFLDQVSTYLAKHLVWLRTRILMRRNKPVPIILRRRRPDEDVTYEDLLLDPHAYWEGYWPGVWAPSGAQQHFRTIKPNDQCWCWSGKLYKHCHLRQERNSAVG